MKGARYVAHSVDLCLTQELGHHISKGSPKPGTYSR